MEDCALFCEAEGFDLFETLSCISHTQICWLPLGSLVIMLSLLLPGLRIYD